MNEQQRKALIQAAIEARANAYAPYSEFLVGAAILTADGKIFGGCNVENASYGLTICAERVAAGSAVAAGSQAFLAVAVATPGGHSPCGACRQFLAEFGGSMTVLLVDSDDPAKVRETSLDRLLPEQFEIPE
ncbi:MAG: cytidine deaminase [Lacipirellulaceae bacterium]